MNELHDIHPKERIYKLYLQALVVGAIVCLLFCLSKILGSNIYVYAGTFIALIFSVVMDRQSVGFFISFICSNTYFIMLGDNALCGYLLLIAFALRIKEILRNLSEDVLFSCLLFLFFVCISSIFFSNWSLLKGMIKSIVIILFFVSLVSENPKNTVTYLSKAYITGAVFGAILGVLYYLINGKDLLPDTALGLRFSGLAPDPNYFSATLLFALALLVFLCIYYSKANLKDLISGIILSLVGLLTLSRGFLLGFIVVVVSVLIYIIFSKKISLKIKVSILFVGAIVVLLTYNLWMPIMSVFIERIVAPETGGGSGRLELYLQYLKAIFSSARSFLIGSPSDEFIINAHNTFIDLLHRVGFLGGIAFCLLLWTIFKRFHKMQGVKLQSLLPLFAVICSYFFLSALTGDNFIFSLILSVQIVALFNNEMEINR